MRSFVNRVIDSLKLDAEGRRFADEVGEKLKRKEPVTGDVLRWIAENHLGEQRH